MAVLTTGESSRIGEALTRWLSRWLVVPALLLAITPDATAQASQEYQIKAVFLFNFAQFVEWPGAAFPDPQAPLVIGVLGENPFGTLLAETVRGEKIGLRPLVLQHYRRVEDIDTCHILFISQSERGNLEQVLNRLQGRAILTVGDAEGFALRGVMIRFIPDKGRIRLRINLDAAKSAGLTISSKLLRPAEIVTSGEKLTMLRNLPIRRKLMLIILLTSAVVMLLMRGAFFTYEFVTFRQATLRQAAILGDILAANSTAALAFENQDDAREILAALKAEEHVAAAALYDRNGHVFSVYPETLDHQSVPATPGADGYRFAETHLAGFSPVLQKNRRLGTLYLRFDTGVVMQEWLWGSFKLALAVMAVILLVAYLLSRSLQKHISEPILALAGTARVISERRDYSVRAAKTGDDELGHLTDAFNQMLAEIQTLNQDLERRVVERTTQLEAANAEFKSLFESIDEGYCIIQMLFDEQDRPVDYRFLTINPAFEKHTGLVNAQGRRILELSPAHEASWFEVYGRIALTGKPARFQNYAAERQRWFDVYAFRYGIPEHRQVAILFSNITERKRSEVQIRELNGSLQQRAGELENANRELESFSYSVSHDLRAPLRHVQGYVEMLSHEAQANLSDKARRYLKTIADAAKEMGQLIDDLLAFSRMSRSEMHQGTVDLAALVKDTRRSLEPTINGREVHWRVADLPAVQGDAPMLKQVFVNLLSNAVKYTGQRPAADIEVGLAGEEEGRTIFFVRDNGAGFDMKYADKLFGVFQRLHRADEFEGTGIGLASVRRIITRHGGRIWAEAKVGAGATFYFTLTPAPAGPPTPPVQK